MEKRHVYPFVAIVGQEEMKTALLLNVVLPSIGGVLVQGEKGTAKTTAVRGLADIMGNTRVVELPVSASEDRVVGTINLNKVIKEGEKQFDPGLLKEADGNILYVDEINLLDDHLVDVLLDAAATGVNYVERDGISVTHSAKFALVGTMNPEEGTLRPQLLDRFGLSVSVTSSLTAAERAEVIRRRIAFERNPEGFLAEYQAESRQLVDVLKNARGLVEQTEVSGEIVELIANLCANLEVQGYRADITTMKAAGAVAALDGRTKISQEDVLEAARFALPHRLKRRPFEDNQLTRDMIREAAEQQVEPPEQDQGKAMRQTS
jgi:magnesium chelatase subunit I